MKVIRDFHEKKDQTRGFIKLSVKKELTYTRKRIKQLFER